MATFKTREAWSYKLFSFNLTVEHIQLYKFNLSDCLLIHHAYGLVVPKLFLFQMLRETSIFVLTVKVDSC